MLLSLVSANVDLWIFVLWVLLCLTDEVLNVLQCVHFAPWLNKFDISLGALNNANGRVWLVLIGWSFSVGHFLFEGRILFLFDDWILSILKLKLQFRTRLCCSGFWSGLGLEWFVLSNFSFYCLSWQTLKVSMTQIMNLSEIEYLLRKFILF